MNCKLKLHSVELASKGRVKLLLVGNQWEPPLKLTVTVGRINDLAVGAKIGDEFELGINRSKK